MLTARIFQAGTLEQSKVNSGDGVIHDVSLISVGEAKGHNVFVDATTLSQVYEFCRKQQTLKVRADHGSGVFSTIGFMDNFKLTNKQVLGDLHIYESESERDRIFEIAEKNPKHMGMSLEFSGEDEVEGDQWFARCEEVTAIALVSDPAANKSLFSKKELEEKKKLSTKDSRMKKEAKKFGNTELAEMFKKLDARMAALEKKLEGESEGEKDFVDEEEQISDKDAEKEDLPAHDPDAEPEVKDDDETELEEGGDSSEDEKSDKKEMSQKPKKPTLEQVKALAAKLGMRILPAGASGDQKSKPKNFEALVDEKTKELGGDKIKAMNFCIQNHKAEYSEYRKKFVSVK